MAKKQGQVNTITETGKPEFKGPGVEGKKAVTTIITIRDGVAQRVLFDENGKEIGVENTSTEDGSGKREAKEAGAKDNEKQDTDA